MVGLGGFALSGVAALADISRRSKIASSQGRRPRQAADGMRFGRGTTVFPPLARWWNSGTRPQRFGRESRAGGGMFFDEVEGCGVGAGKDDETKGLGRLGGNHVPRNEIKEHSRSV